MLRTWLVITAIVLAVLLVGCNNTGDWGNAPNFTYTNYDGTQAKLSSHAGKVVVVNFWAVW